MPTHTAESQDKVAPSNVHIGVAYRPSNSANSAASLLLRHLPSAAPLGPLPALLKGRGTSKAPGRHDSHHRSRPVLAGTAVCHASFCWLRTAGQAERALASELLPAEHCLHSVHGRQGVVPAAVEESAPAGRRVTHAGLAQELTAVACMQGLPAV